MLSLLHTFIAVYEQRSFSKAAQILYISQPTVTVHIHKLEDLTDTKLFRRGDKKEVFPTKFGDLFYKKAINLVNDWGETLVELHQKKLDRKHFTFLISHSIGEGYFKDLIPKIIVKFPDFDFDFFIKNSEEIVLETVKNANVIGFIEKPLNRTDLYQKKIGIDSLVHVGDINSPYWLMREPHSGVRYFQEIYLLQNNIHLHQITTNNINYFFSLLENNIGQTLISKKLLDRIPHVKWKETAIERDLNLIKKEPPLPDSDTAHLVEFIANELQE